MRFSNRLVRPVLSTFSFLVTSLFLTLTPLSANPISVAFKPSGSNALAVNAPGNSLAVSVFIDNGKLASAVWKDSQPEKQLSLIGHDQTTRLCFFENSGSSEKSALTWENFYVGKKAESLTAKGSNGSKTCQFQAWVHQVRGKVLPLALIKVNFSGTAPKAGTPLLDSSGKIVALILQPASGNSAYAIPCQAVHRVHRDMTDHRKLVRGWLGFSLSTNSNVPRIVRVLPGSPAAKANLKPNDVLLKAGRFSTDSYPEAVNALFYTKPGEATSIQIRRNEQTIPCKVIPIAQKPGA